MKLNEKIRKHKLQIISSNTFMIFKFSLKTIKTISLKAY
jgi:hypothetical protein